RLLVHHCGPSKIPVVVQHSGDIVDGASCVVPVTWRPVNALSLLVSHAGLLRFPHVTKRSSFFVPRYSNEEPCFLCCTLCGCSGRCFYLPLVVPDGIRGLGLRYVNPWIIALR